MKRFLLEVAAGTTVGIAFACAPALGYFVGAGDLRMTLAFGGLLVLSLLGTWRLYRLL